MKKIEFHNISKRFHDKLVLDSVSFEIEQGEIFGLIGPNGAGKSTLINLLIGLFPADQGQIRIDGKELTENAVEYKRKIGLVPQELALMEDMSAGDNMEYFGTYYGLHGHQLKEKIKEMLEVTELYDKRKQKVKEFSGGMKRRLNIAVAMMHEPEILIMDEPTVGVDPQSRNHIFDFVRRLNEERQVTVIYTSHYMEEVEHLCQKIYIMDEGRKVAYGTIDELKALQGGGEDVSLEELFLAMTGKRLRD